MRNVLEVLALSTMMFIAGWLWAVTGVEQSIVAGEPVHIMGVDYVCALPMHGKALPRPPIITPED